MVFENKPLDLPWVVGPDATVARKHDRWCQPEFTLSIRRPDKDMRGLIALVSVKMKSECPDTQNRWLDVYHMQRCEGIFSCVATLWLNRRAGGVGCCQGISVSVAAKTKEQQRREE